MSIEGRLTIDLYRAADGTGRVTIASSRPLGVARAFVGKTPDETVRTVPLLFSVCGMAQVVASVQACEQALAIAPSAATNAVRRVLVLAETLREHLIRAVMDWPRFLGLEVNKVDMLRVMRLSEGLKRALDPGTSVLTIGGDARPDTARAGTAIDDLAALVEALVIGEALDVWRARRSTEDLRSWSLAAATPTQRLVRAVLDRGWADAGGAETKFLPHLDEGDLASRLLGGDAADFVASPTWDGLPHETTSLARQAASPLVEDIGRVYGNNCLLARIAARLVEIAALPSLMRSVAEGCSHEEGRANETAAATQRARSGRGLAQVEAARGRLVHGVEIEADLVRRYAILAPTEWNFHAEGGAAQGLADIATRRREAREIGDLFVTTVDPCVAYDLRVA